MTWASRRKLIYAGSMIASVLIVGALVVRHYTIKPATCSDNRKNGDEVGVDCGGSCFSYCINELAQPKVRWVRSFPVAPGVYHAVAYIEHNNPNAAVVSAPYSFKLYDENNTLIATKDGSTYIGPAGRTAIVESLIQTGNVTPTITRFSFIEPLHWQKIGPQFAQLVINADRYVFDNTTGITRLVATLKNDARTSYTDIDTVAILYDKNDNTMTALKIAVPSLPALSSKTVFFTWPFTLPEKPTRVEIIPRINPYTTTLQ